MNAIFLKNCGQQTDQVIKMAATCRVVQAGNTNTMLSHWCLHSSHMTFAVLMFDYTQNNHRFSLEYIQVSHALSLSKMCSHHFMFRPTEHSGSTVTQHCTEIMVKRTKFGHSFPKLEIKTRYSTRCFCK